MLRGDETPKAVAKDLNKPHSKSFQSQEKDGTQEHTKLGFKS